MSNHTYTWSITLTSECAHPANRIMVLRNGSVCRACGTYAPHPKPSQETPE